MQAAIRYDYLERLQSRMAQFENELHVAVTMVTDILKVRPAWVQQRNSSPDGRLSLPWTLSLEIVLNC
jgi:hypothetical protein